MNFIFISPNFPKTYWNFCRCLKQNGVRVLGIGDAPYELLEENLKQNLQEYYKVSSLENYEEVYKACAFFAFRYGKIDWIESNNEYWLNLDAELRELFHVTTGMFPKQLNVCQHKSLMKAKYAEAGVPTARWLISEDKAEIREFAEKVNYSLVAKPDRGVGASDTMRIHNAEELEQMLKTMHSGMIVEEFVHGTVCTFDGIINNQGKVVFATSHVYLGSVMDSVNEKQPIGCYSLKTVPEDLRSAGERTLQAFGVRDRFFHLEFFRLDCDQEGLGRQGDIIGLEVNMRPPGGFLPDMIDYANDIDIYQIWADTLIDHEPCYNPERPYSSVFVGRRKEQAYQHSMEWIIERYQGAIIQRIAMDPALAEAMGDEVLIAWFPTEQQVFDFYADCVR